MTSAVDVRPLTADEDHSSLSERPEGVDYLIAVTSSFTGEPVRPSLAFWMMKESLPGRLESSPFNQIFQQLLDPGSLFATNRHGLNVILLRFEDSLYLGSLPRRQGTKRAEAPAKTGDHFLGDLSQDNRALRAARLARPSHGVTTK